MAKAKFYMQKQGNALQFMGSRLEVYKAWVKGLPDMQIIEAVFSKRRVAKTNPQLGYWFAVLMPFSVGAFLEQGIESLQTISYGKYKIEIPIDEDQADKFFKTIFQIRGKLKQTQLKRNMNDEEMGRLIDLTVRFLAEELGAVAPEPEKERTVT